MAFLNDLNASLLQVYQLRQNRRKAEANELNDAITSVKNLASINPKAAEEFWNQRLAPIYGPLKFEGTQRKWNFFSLNGNRFAADISNPGNVVTVVRKGTAPSSVKGLPQGDRHESFFDGQGNLLATVPGKKDTVNLDQAFTKRNQVMNLMLRLVGGEPLSDTMALIVATSSNLTNSTIARNLSEVQEALSGRQTLDDTTLSWALGILSDAYSFYDNSLPEDQRRLLPKRLLDIIGEPLPPPKPPPILEIKKLTPAEQSQVEDILQGLQ